MNEEENMEIKYDLSDDDIVALITDETLTTNGVKGLSSGLTNRGIKFSKNNKVINLDIYIIVEYNIGIPQLAWELQSKIKERLTPILDEEIKEINIHVQGVER